MAKRPGTEVNALFELDLPHGRAVALAIPDGGALAGLTARLRPEELELAASWGLPRRRTWIAGRAALRAALERAGFEAPAILSDDRGAPVMPAGVVGSVSHKERVAVALVGRAVPDVCIGIDVELDVSMRVDIARKVLTEDEQAELSALTVASRQAEVRLRFSAKEALYKALDPFVRRYVGFQEVAVTPMPDGSARVVMHLPGAEGRFDVDVRWLRRDGLVLTTARVRRPPRGF